jgi:hypothetical protein
MSDRRTVLLLIALLLAGYGLYKAAYLPALLVDPISPLVLICFVLQVALAIAAAAGVWRDARWSAGVVVLLGVVIALTWLIDGFVLGIVAYLEALLRAVIALLVTIAIAVYVQRGQARAAP